MRSFLARLILLYSLLRDYSWATNLVPITTNMTITMAKLANKLQSPTLHFSNPGVPLKKLIASKKRSSPKLINYFFHTP
jgi:hypothetical protein